MKDLRLMSLLGALRNFNDYITANGRLSAESLASQIRTERILTDRVMFNLGWYAAKGVDVADLGGTASTETLVPELLQCAELASNLADATKRCEDANAKLAELDRPGRKKGSYEEWHFDPGYSVVVAMIELDPKKKIADHIRWAVKEGWLDGKNTKDTKHRRRIELIQQRQALEERNRIEAMGDNVVSLADRQKKHKNKRR